MTVKIHNGLCYDNEDSVVRLRGILHCYDVHIDSASSVVFLVYEFSTHGHRQNQNLQYSLTLTHGVNSGYRPMRTNERQVKGISCTVYFHVQFIFMLSTYVTMSVRVFQKNPIFIKYLLYDVLFMEYSTHFSIFYILTVLDEDLL